MSIVFQNILDGIYNTLIRKHIQSHGVRHSQTQSVSWSVSWVAVANQLTQIKNRICNFVQGFMYSNNHHLTAPPHIHR